MIRRISREIAKAQGLKRYFTGHPCGRGHVAERFVADGRCVQCKRESRHDDRRDRHKHVRPLALHIIRDCETERIIQQSPLIDPDDG